MKDAQNLNFHMTFPPEPRYLGRILEAADGRVRSTQELSAQTGIPMGKSTGKVKPHIEYAAYMGLILPETMTRTPLGEEVLREDPQIGEKLTQLLCHGNLTSRPCHTPEDGTGAPLWHFLYRHLLPGNQGSLRRAVLPTLLEGEFGDGVNFTPAITAYTKHLTQLHFLEETDGRITVRPMRPERELLYGYGYILLHEWEKVFPREEEITESAMEQLQFAACFGWSREQEDRVLQWLADRGILSLNRQMYPVIIRRQAAAQALIPKLYSLLL